MESSRKTVPVLDEGRYNSKVKRSTGTKEKDKWTNRGSGRRNGRVRVENTRRE